MKDEKKEESARLLSGDGITLGEEAWNALQRYVGLVREWNPYASLVATGEVAFLEERHVIDSLSLAGVVLRVGGNRVRLMDIGTGGGFPAIPIKVALPECEVTLVERSSRKVGFLRKVVGALGLTDVTILCGEFPACAAECRPDVVTARAVEKPGRLLREMQGFLGEGMVFLCQSGDPRGDLPGEFHVERVDDAWTAAGLRRGELFLVTRRRATF